MPPPGEAKKPNTPEKNEQPGQLPEVQRPPKKDIVEANAHAARGDMRDEINSTRLDQIGKRKQEIDDEQARLQKEAAAKRDKESWVNNPASSPVFDPTGQISEGVEAKSAKIKEKMDGMGIGDDTNLNVVKQKLKEIVYDQYTKTGKDSDITKAFADKIDDKITYLFDELKKTYDSQKQLFANPHEFVENFSVFTATNFFKNDFLQGNELKDFLLLEKSDYEIFIGNFRKYLGLVAEKKQLEGEEAGLSSFTLPPEELIKQKRITFEKTQITIPKDKQGADLDTYLKTAVAAALPPLVRAPEKAPEKIVNYLVGLLKEKKPQPDQTFELSPDGQWTIIDVKAEQKKQDDTKAQAKQQAEQQAAAPESEKPFEFSLQGILKAIMDALKDVLKFLGVKFGATSFEDLIKEWKDVPVEEKNQIKLFFTETKNYISNPKNIEVLIANPTEARRILKAKKESKNPDQSWGSWFQTHLNKFEQDQINGSGNVEAKNVADYFISENKPNEAPAVLLQKKPGEKPRQNTDTPDQQVSKIVEGLENAPYAADLKNILGDYINKYGSGGIKDKLKGNDVKVSDYLNGMIDNFMQNDPNLKDRYQKGLVSKQYVISGALESAFRYALGNAKTPEEKQKITQILNQVNATVVTVVKGGTPATGPAAATNTDILSSRESRSMGEAIYGKEDIKKAVDTMNALKKEPQWPEKVLRARGKYPGIVFDQLWKDPQSGLDAEIRTLFEKMDQYTKDIQTKLKEAMDRLFPDKTNRFEKAISEIAQKPNWKEYFDQQYKSSKEFRAKIWFMSLGTIPTQFAQAFGRPSPQKFTGVNETVINYINDKIKTDNPAMDALELSGIVDLAKKLHDEYPDLDMGGLLTI